MSLVFPPNRETKNLHVLAVAVAWDCSVLTLFCGESARIAIAGPALSQKINQPAFLSKKGFTCPVSSGPLSCDSNFWWPNVVCLSTLTISPKNPLNFWSVEVCGLSQPLVRKELIFMYIFLNILLRRLHFCSIKFVFHH